METSQIKLTEFNELAYSAYTGTSFSPEKRRDDLILSSENEINEDIENMPESEKLQYIAGYKKHLSAWLSAKSRCVSTMITGGSNFPVRRAETANHSEHNKSIEFTEWRERALEAIAKRLKQDRPQHVKDAEEWARIEKSILSTCQTIIGIDNGTERGYSRPLFVSNLTNRINTIAKGGNVELIKKCLDLIKVINEDIKKPVISTNNSIWKLADIAEANREAKFDKANKPNREWQTENCLVRFNYEFDRLQLVFESKPTYEVIGRLKKNAFKWSPSNMAWQRQLTNNAIYGTINIIGEFRTVKS